MIVLLAIASGLLTSQVSEMRGEPAQELRSLDTFLSSFVSNNHLHGAAVVIVKNDRLIYARSTGFALSDDKLPLNPDTLVPIGSVTKYLTALGTMKLVQDGKLQLEDTFLSKLPEPYVDGLPIADERWRSISIRQLLQMSAGIPESLAQVWKFRDKLKSGRKEFYRLVLGTKLAYEPGRNQAYNNCNFSILGDVIEATSKLQWREFVLNQVLKPLGIPKLPSYDEVGYVDASPNDWDSGAAGVACLSPIQIAKVVTEFSKSSSTMPLTLKTRNQMLSAPPAPLSRGSDGSIQMGYYGLGLMSVSLGPSSAAFSHGGSLTNAHTFFIRQEDGTVLVGFYCGELKEDKVGTGGQWKMSEDLLNVLKSQKTWPVGRRF